MELILLQCFFGLCISMMILLRIYKIRQKPVITRGAVPPKYTPSFHRHQQENDVFKDTFYHNLQTTIDYTSYVIDGLQVGAEIDYRNILRTINPVWKDAPFYTFTENEVSSPFEGFDYQVLLDQSMKKKKLTTNTRKKQTINGRILRFEIDITTRDGAPCIESEFFVDDNDIPPIDTWFYATSKYLYCLIPTPCIEIMQHTMDVEILESYLWMDEYNPEFYAQIIEKLTWLNTTG